MKPKLQDGHYFTVTDYEVDVTIFGGCYFV